MTAPRMTRRRLVEPDERTEVQRVLAEVRAAYDAASPRGQYETFNEHHFGRALREIEARHGVER